MTLHYTSRTQYSNTHPEPLLEHCTHLRDSTQVEPTQAKNLYLDLYTAQQILHKLTHYISTIDSVDDVVQTELDICRALLASARSRADNPVGDLGTLADIHNASLDSCFDTLANEISRTETLLTTAQEQTTVEPALQIVEDANAVVDRTITKLGKRLFHTAYSTNQYKNPDRTGCVDYCLWDDVGDGVQDAEGISVTGTCILCGKQYDQYFEFRGIFDNDTGDYVMQK